MSISSADQAYIALGKLAAQVDAMDDRVSCLILDRTRPEVVAARAALADESKTVKTSCGIAYRYNAARGTFQFKLSTGWTDSEALEDGVTKLRGWKALKAQSLTEKDLIALYSLLPPE